MRINSHKMENSSGKPRLKRTTEQIKLLLMEAVGEIIRTKGFKSLNASNITKQASVARHSIDKYFGTTENLVEQYLQTDDNSVNYSKLLCEPDDVKQVDRLRYVLKSALEKKYRRLLNNQVLHSACASEACETTFKSNMESSKSEEPNFTFVSAEYYFKNKAIDFISLRLILESSVKFLALKSELKDSDFCGVDTASFRGREQIVKTLMGIIDLAFDQKLQK